MNLWMDIAIPLIATCAASIICNIVALWLLYHEKAENGMLISAMKSRNETIDRMDSAIKATTAERDALQKGLTQMEKAFDEVVIDRNRIQLQLDEALRPKLPDVDGAVKKRASRAKPKFE